MTNSSLGVTSASLTHMIKMCEPLFTSFILAYMGKITVDSDVVFIIIIVLISAIGSGPLSDAPASLVGVTFSVGSNLCFALRNIGTKYFIQTDSSSHSKTTLEGFASISLIGFLLILPTVLIVFVRRADDINMLSENLWISSICHAVYNIVSLTMVLSIFNPVQHSLLNVGKRISIVIALYVFSQRSLTPVNIVSAIVCLAVSVYGVTVVKEDKESHRQRVGNRCWALIVFRYQDDQ